MLDQTFDKIKKIHNLSELRLPMLFFGLAMWVVTPIIGNLPLLLSIQLDLLKPRQRKPKLLSVNNLLLILVILSVSVYISSFEIFADTRVYLDIYQTIDTKGIFDNELVKDRYEFVLFLFLYPIHILTNGSEYWCLFLVSLICNFAVVFYVSKKLSAKYYPTILILIFSTFNYYSQLFYMRQFLSIMLVMMAVASLESSWKIFALWSFLTIFSHLSSAMYISVCFGSKLLSSLGSKINLKLQKLDRVFLYIVLGFLAILVIYITWLIYNNPQEIYRYVNNIIDLLPEQRLSDSIQNRVTNYDGRDTETFSFNIFRIIASLSIGIFVLVRGFKKLTSQLLSLDIIYLISLLQIAFILVTGFNQRIAYLFLTFYGFFFSIGLSDRSKIKPLGIVSSLVVFAAAANTFNFLTIQANMIDIDGWSFFDGQPLAMSAFDYILYFFQSI